MELLLLFWLFESERRRKAEEYNRKAEEYNRNLQRIAEINEAINLFLSKNTPLSTDLQRTLTGVYADLKTLSIDAGLEHMEHIAGTIKEVRHRITSNYMTGEEKTEWDTSDETLADLFLCIPANIEIAKRLWAAEMLGYDRLDLVFKPIKPCF
jgi:hypothetical protein